MATLEQLSAALVKADAAGDAADARALAGEIRRMRAAPAEAAPAQSKGAGLMQTVGNIAAGAVRGAGSIGATLLAPVDAAARAVGIENSVIGRRDRREAMDSALDELGAETDSLAYKGAMIGAEIAGTAGAGGALARGAAAIPAIASRAPNLMHAIASGGMTAGSTTGYANALTRAAGGAISGGAQAGMVNPTDAGTGAMIGMATPAALQLAGKVGGSVYRAVKSGAPNAGRMLANALGLSDAELQAVIRAANAAPDSIVDGSKLTLSQALQMQGANHPSVKMLDRIVAGGPGGDVLLRRFEDQGAARLDALRKQGAQTYQGAAATEAENVGNALAAQIRTQAADEQELVRAAWGSAEGGTGVHGRAASEGAALQIPIDRMRAVVGDRMGDGYTGSAAAAQKTLDEAQRIGTDVLPGLRPLAESAAKTQSLEQAVRARGGIQPGAYLGAEIAELGRKHSSTTGLVSQHGRDVEAMADEMHARGFLPDNDPATLVQALRSGGGRRIFADDHMEAGFQRMAEQAAGDMPEAERIAKAVPFKSFQALRSSSGRDAARLSEKTGSEVEAGVLTQFEKLMAGRADEAAMGNLLPGESMSEGLMQEYKAARELTREVKERYGAAPIASILRKPGGQNYALNGNEVTSKLWHGGAGLAADVSALKQTMSRDNFEPAMNALRRFVMTDAASKTTASGSFGAALPKYVEARMPGLEEALNPEQLNALTRVAADIRNAESAAAVPGLRGSDTQAKIARALDAGLLDSSLAKTLGKFLSVKGVGVETARNKLADLVIAHKGRTLSELLANPKAAAAALQDSGFTKQLDSGTLTVLAESVLRSAPALAAD